MLGAETPGRVQVWFGLVSGDPCLESGSPRREFIAVLVCLLAGWLASFAVSLLSCLVANGWLYGSIAVMIHES